MNDEKKKQKNKDSRTLLFRSVAGVVVVLALIIGLTRAWFTNRTNIATLVQIAPPSSIAIKGAHGEALTELNLDYTDKDKAGDKVTIRRVVSIESDSEKHQLEIVHTTNLKDLTFNLYRATELDTESRGESVIKEGNYTYSYDLGKPVEGNYINKKSESTGNYSYATNAKHSENYGDYDKVQPHAEPLYWKTNVQIGNELKDTKTASDSEKKYLTYYVLEISWTETTKETDIFYLLAQTVN